MNSQQFDPQSSGPPRFVAAVFGFVFLGIGLTVIGFLWSQPFGEFGSPPLIFRIFGSFIAVAFVAMGGGTAYAALTGKPNPMGPGRRAARMMRDMQSELPQSPSGPPTVGSYSCDSCGAPLDSGADVSPHGDVKCDHCERWFNIHGK